MGPGPNPPPQTVKLLPHEDQKGQLQDRNRPLTWVSWAILGSNQ
jgi:hypothetical protein